MPSATAAPAGYTAPTRAAVSTYEDPVDAPMRGGAMPLQSSTGGQFGERTIGLTETRVAFPPLYETNEMLTTIISPHKNVFDGGSF